MRLPQIILLLVASACSNRSAEAVDAAEAPAREAGSSDVLVGRAIGSDSTCGLAGARCCPGNQCAGSGCCVEGHCTEAGAACTPLSGACQAGSCGGCGGVGEPCCGGGTCTALGTRCVGGSCAPCGLYGLQCCPGSVCLVAGTACSLSAAGSGAVVGVCAACGAPGLRCCAGACAAGGCCVADRMAGDRCVPGGGACGPASEGGGVCRNGRCEGCGLPGEPCCTGRCNQSTLTCDPSTRTCTTTCGRPGQGCCPATGCQPGHACLPDPVAGVSRCLACGLAGQPCCSGTIPCPLRANPAERPDGGSPGGCCLNGLCIAEGTSCQIGDAGLGTCNAGACSGCGSPGAPCCPGAIRGQAACGSGDVVCLMAAPPPPDAMAPPDAAQILPTICQPCGGPGQVCCPLNRCSSGCCSRKVASDPGTCVAEGAGCENGSVCSGGSCGNCGNVGQPCCPSSTCTATRTTCRAVANKGEICLACGGRGEPCCFDQLNEPVCTAGTLVCRTGLCIER